MNDTFDLARFVAAQAPVFAGVEAELAAGRKTSHWMWFVFPQFRGLGRSDMARHFGITSRDEAAGYWQHPVLGLRLKRCTGLMLAVTGRSALAILGSPDDLKFRSCMTLFEQAVPDEPLFAEALDRFFSGERDGTTLALLSRA